MKCTCGGELAVKDSRPTTFGAHVTVRRRRKCMDCSRMMTTFELEKGVAARMIQQRPHIMRVLETLRRASKCLEFIHEYPEQIIDEVAE